MQGSEGAHLLARVEIDLFAANGNDRDVVVELAERKIADVEDCAVAVYHLHGPGCEAGRAGQGDIEQSNGVRRPALLLPHVLRFIDVLQLFLLALSL
jgi:hypothetical protein